MGKMSRCRRLFTPIVSADLTKYKSCTEYVHFITTTTSAIMISNFFSIFKISNLDAKFGLLEVVLRHFQDEYRGGPSRLSELHLILSEFMAKRVGKILVNIDLRGLCGGPATRLSSSSSTVPFE